MRKNEWHVEARVVAPVEIRRTKNGHEVGEMRAVLNHSRKDKDGKYQEDGATFFNIIAWKEKAIELKEFAKGEVIEVKGAIKSREYQRKDGTKGSALEVTANSFSKVAPKQPGNSLPVTGSEFGNLDSQEIPF